MNLWIIILLIILAFKLSFIAITMVFLRLRLHLSEVDMLSTRGYMFVMDLMENVLALLSVVELSYEKSDKKELIIK